MDILEQLRQLAESRGGKFTPLLVLGFALPAGGVTQAVSIRAVAEDRLLRTFLTVPAGRQWLHDTIDSLCDATRPPDDQPRDARITHVRVESTEFPRDGTGFPR